VELLCVGKPVRSFHKYRLFQFPSDAASFSVDDIRYPIVFDGPNLSMYHRPQKDANYRDCVVSNRMRSAYTELHEKSVNYSL
jgi:hypothetical protein